MDDNFRVIVRLADSSRSVRLRFTFSGMSSGMSRAVEVFCTRLYSFERLSLQTTDSKRQRAGKEGRACQVAQRPGLGLVSSKLSIS